MGARVWLASMATWMGWVGSGESAMDERANGPRRAAKEMPAEKSLCRFIVCSWFASDREAPMIVAPRAETQNVSRYPTAGRFPDNQKLGARLGSSPATLSARKEEGHA